MLTNYHSKTIRICQTKNPQLGTT